MSKNTKRSKASSDSGNKVSYSPKLDKLSTNSDKFCFNCQTMNYSIQADSSTNLRLNYRCKFCNKLI